MSGIGLNPNMLVNPAISPPYPLWLPTTTYYLGDVVSYAGQNWLCLFFADNPTQQFSVGDLYAPDLYPITLNGVPGKDAGVYVPIAAGPVAQNLNGSSWINLSLATPPAPVWSPTTAYNVGDTVMYPPWSPGTFWRATVANVNQTPALAAFNPTSVPPRIEPQSWQRLSGASVPSQNPATFYLADPVLPPPPPTDFAGTAGTPIELTWTIPDGVIYNSLILTNETTAQTYTLAGDAEAYSDIAPASGVNIYSLVGTFYSLQTVPVIVSVSTEPSPQTDLVATSSATIPINLTWSLPTDGTLYDEQILTNDFGLNVILLGGDVSYSDTTAVPVGTLVTYSLVGTNSAGTSPAVAAYAYITQPPAPVAESAVQAPLLPNICDVTWSFTPFPAFTTAPYTSFNIYVDGAPAVPPSVIAGASPQTLPITLDPLLGPYTITVRGVSVIGESPDSNGLAYPSAP